MSSEPSVLIVDDEALFRSSVIDSLSSATPNYRVHGAANGQEALEAHAREPADVIVTDVNMPVMDGLELMLELRKLQFSGKVIVVTAFGNARIAGEASELGAFGYVEKPVDLPQLIQAIRSAAEGRHSHIEGLTLAGFVQLLEMERKTCLLRVSKNDQSGELLFRNGTLIDARLGRRKGDRAALELLAWEDGAHLDLRTGIVPREVTITEPLSHLLMEAMRLRDEKARVSQSPADRSGQAGQIRPDSLEDCLRESMSIEGAIGVALVDHRNGSTLGKAGGGQGVDLDVAARGNTRMVRAKMQVMEDLNLDDEIDDILITLGEQYHLIRPLTTAPNLFLYLVIDRSQANLGMVRHRLKAIEANFLL